MMGRELEQRQVVVFYKCVRFVSCLSGSCHFFLYHYDMLSVFFFFVASLLFFVVLSGQLYVVSFLCVCCWDACVFVACLVVYCSCGAGNI